jgi:hypothetical protein
MCAGLFSRFERGFIAHQFDALQLHYERIHNAEQTLLRGAKPMAVRDVDGLREKLADLRSRNVIIAASQYGASSLSVAALSSMGAKIASLYWKIPKRYLQIFEQCKVPLIDMTKQEDTLRLFKTLLDLQADNYLLFLLSDVPGKSRKHYRFLGYDVKCSNLIEVYSRYKRSMVLPMHSRIISDSEILLHCGAPFGWHRNMTQRLLSDLESLIYQNHSDYSWSGASIIFSDSRAMLNGLSLLPDFLEWRDQIPSGTQPPAT